MTTTAIVGAGLSGLAAAHTFLDLDPSATVTLFEERSDVGGRATTRQREGFTYDDGAQYIKGGTPLITTLITERFSLPDLVDIPKPVWTFDAQNVIREGDPQQNADPKWTYRSGLATLAIHMAAGLDVRLTTPITRVQRVPSGWRLFDEEDQRVGEAERLLITIPATQARELIMASDIPAELRQAVAEGLGEAVYNPLLSVMLGYTPTPRIRPFYALVNTDKAHAISWLAWEHEKAASRTPPGSGLLIAQMAPGYSRDHWEMPAETLSADVARRVATLIAETLPAPSFTDVQRWRYALPGALADANRLNALTLPHGLAFCGDAFVGGRVHLALEHGSAVAQSF